MIMTRVIIESIRAILRKIETKNEAFRLETWKV